MKTVLLALSWIFGLFFLFLFLLSLYTQKWLASIPVFVITLLLLPPARRLFSNVTGITLPVWLRGLLVPVLFTLFVYLLFATMGNKDSIYKTPGVQAKLMAIYDNRMSQWPVPYEAFYLDTQYGKVHVIASGPEDGPPILLLHASSMAGWSWLYNIDGLNRTYRTFAIDTIGDTGRSILADIDRFPQDGESLAAFYQEIMDQLGVAKATFIGASQGGFISTNMALYAPERVESLILSGPMGYTGTNLSVLRIVLTTLFPVRPLQDNTTRWAFGDNPNVNEVVGEWFGILLAGVVPRQAQPKPFTPEQLQSLKVPVLLLLGTKDGLVGNPEDTIKLADNIPDIRVEVLDAGHLISAEQPERFNELVSGFITNH